MGARRASCDAPVSYVSPAPAPLLGGTVAPQCTGRQYAGRVTWLGRFRPRTRPHRPSRLARRDQRVDRVSLEDLRPDPTALLGQTAYLELALFETATGVAGRATDLADREALTRIAARILAKHHGIVDLVARRGLDSAAVMAPFAADIERYRRRLGDTTWHEAVLTLHLAAGLFDDFFARLAAGLPGEEGRRIGELLRVDIGHETMSRLLAGAMDADRRLRSRLALWGRRIVGDTLLVARSALERSRTAEGAPIATDDVRIEPVLTDLIAAHTRRMDRLGLTA